MMSKQLAVASAFSVFAMSALALFAPGSAGAPGNAMDDPPPFALTVPSFSVVMPLLD